MSKAETGAETNSVNREETKEKKKKSGFGTWLYRIIILILICVMGYSGYRLYDIYSGYEAAKTVYNDLADDVGAGKMTGTDNSHLHIDWDKLHERNPDIIGWIRCKDTRVNYPILKGVDNDQYLRTTVDGEYNIAGSIFVDYESRNPFKDFLTIVYGHWMHDGSMFTMLTEYFGSKGEDYYNKHPVFEIYTPDQNYDLEIYSCAKIHETDADAYKFSFADGYGNESTAIKEDYVKYSMGLNELPNIDVTVDPAKGERIAMLSTCTPQLDQYRHVLWGKLVPID